MPGYTSQLLNDFIHKGSLFNSFTVGTTATEVRIGATALEGRHTVLIINDSANDISVGFDNTVTTANGILISAGSEREFRTDPDNVIDLFAIAVSGASNVRLAEIK